MRLSLFIAKRYVRAKRTFNAINIMSMVATTGIFVGTAALIIVLSVFNGFEQLIFSLYNVVDPDIRITALHGKTFEPDQKLKQFLIGQPDVAGVSEIIEENVLLKCGSKQYFATMRGVSLDTVSKRKISARVVEGRLTFKRQSTDLAAIGQGMASYLQVEVMDQFNPIYIYVPDKSVSPSGLSAENAFKEGVVLVSSVLNVQQEFDARYLLTSFQFAEELMGYQNEVTALEVNLKSGTDPDIFRERLTAIFGKDLKIETRAQQHQLLYQIMQTEKWAVFFILLFILVIASFNVIGSLTMLTLEKRSDIAVLQAMGMPVTGIKKIFLFHGLWLTGLGALAGVIAGVLIALAQQYYGFIKLGEAGSFVVEAYPVRVIFTDILIVMLCAVLTGIMAARYAIRNIRYAGTNISSTLKNN